MQTDKMITIRDLKFAYGNGQQALGGIDLDIEPGEFILLSGSSGSGKTTLARCLNGLVPNFYNGKLEGSVTVDCKLPSKTPTKDLAKIVGMLFQDPEAMFLSSDVKSEVLFGPACLGIECSVNRVLDELGIAALKHRPLHELSGGEKQKVALAAVLACRPKVLVLDEPLSELDKKSADGLMKLLKKLNRAGMTIILLEQRIAKLQGFATREISLKAGKVAYDGKPRKGGRPMPAAKTKPGDVLVRLQDVSFAYDKAVFEKFSHDFREGELVVLEGPNGSGKTTLLKLIMGLLKPESGVVNVGGIENPGVEQTAGAVGYVFQNPDNHLFAETVKEEVEFILKNTGRTGNVDSALKQFNLLHYKDSYPRYLSGGEKQRVALASIMVAKPKVLLLDEPTRGMDSALKKALADYLSKYAKQGNLVIMATHDAEMASCATRRLRL